MTPTGYKAYQKARVETASPTKWIPMLFNEACVSTEIGIQAVQEKDFTLANTRLVKVQDILLELMGALDFRVAISQNLYQLYEYIHNLLVDGNIKKDTAPLEEALTLLKDLHETWTAVARSAQSDADPMSGGVSIAR